MNKITNEMIQRIDDDFIKHLEEQSKKYRPCATLFIDEDSTSVELMVDNSKSTYGEWIKGEGADICLIRENETNKVVGVRLPLYDTNFSVCFTDGINVKLNEGFLKNKS